MEPDNPAVYAGQKIRVLSIGQAPAHPDSPLKVGDVGVVLVIDSQHTVHAVWPGQQHWGLVPGLDSWELVSDGNSGPSGVTPS